MIHELIQASALSDSNYFVAYNLVALPFFVFFAVACGFVYHKASSKWILTGLLAPVVSVFLMSIGALYYGAGISLAISEIRAINANHPDVIEFQLKINSQAYSEASEINYRYLNFVRGDKLRALLSAYVVLEKPHQALEIKVKQGALTLKDYKRFVDVLLDSNKAEKEQIVRHLSKVKTQRSLFWYRQPRPPHHRITLATDV